MDDTIKIGMISALAIGIGINIGGGLWTTPAVAGAVTGPAAVTSLSVGGIAILLALPAYFTFTKIWPVSPGHYYYATRFISENKTLSQLVGFVGVWCLVLISGIFSYRYMMFAGASFLNSVIPGFSIDLITFILITVPFIITWFGLRIVGLVEIALSASLLVAISIFLIAGIPHVEMSNFTSFITNGYVNYFSSIGIVFLMMAGALFVIDIGGEVNEGENTLDKTLVYSIYSVLILDTLVILVVVGTIPSSELANQSLIFVAQQNFSGPIVMMMGIGALVAGLTTVLAIIPMFTRYIRALALDGLLPRSVARENRFGEPKYILAGMYIVSAVPVLFDVPVQALAAGFAFPLIGWMILTTLAGTRFPVSHSDLFEKHLEGESRFLTPTIVRWSSLLATVSISAIFMFLAYVNTMPFMVFLGVAVSGAIVYFLILSQSSDSTSMRHDITGESTITDDN